MRLQRQKTRKIHVGTVPVGGDSPISIQTMTKTDTRDTDATIAQIDEIASVGCDIVRLAVVDEEAAKSLSRICGKTRIPIIADIHFDHRLALIALDAGVDGLRINPGNIGSKSNVKEVVAAASDRLVPIRIGVNAGSLEKDILTEHGGATAEALVESAMRHVAILEALDYHEVKISVKASDVPRTLEAYRLLSSKTDYPLHLGVTEAGTFLPGTVRSSVAMGILLSEGIGDTIRVSLTDSPLKEVKVGLELLRSLNLRAPGPSVISCPTCGRVQVDIVRVSTAVETELEKLYRDLPEGPRPSVAVMGCMVNGPGEAKEADIAVAGGGGKFALYSNGKYQGSVSEEQVVGVLIASVRDWIEHN